MTDARSKPGNYWSFTRAELDRLCVCGHRRGEHFDYHAEPDYCNDDEECSCEGFIDAIEARDKQ